MADAATMTVKAVLLPYEIQTTLKDLTFAYTPADANDGWYYKLTNVTTSSGDLIAASNYLQKGTTAAGLAVGGSDTSVHANDLCKFVVDVLLTFFISNDFLFIHPIKSL